MNTFMVRRLIYKDWYFNRWPIVVYVAAGALSLGLVGTGGTTAFFAGSVGLVTVLISIGIHLTMTTVVHERTEQTLPFVMTLPLSTRDYTTAKVLANVAIFGSAWTALVVGTVAVIAGRGALPDGLIPYAITILGEIFASYCLLLAVAIVSESMVWTIGAIVLGNLLVQAVMYGVANAPGMKETLVRDSIVWRQPVVGVLGIEAAVIVLSLALTFYLQDRKTDFL